MSIRVSACIICKDEERRIAAALDSLAWSDDVVVVDSGSTDRTLEIARNHPARPRIIHHDWQGYSLQRKFAVSQCWHDWVMTLDADEECDADLIRAIGTLDDTVAAHSAAFRMARRNYIAGRHVRCWDPDYQVRLIHRERVEWDATSMPEVRRPKAGFAIADLPGAILHNRVGDVRPIDFIDGTTMQDYAWVLAEALSKRGTRSGLLNLLLRPALAFLKYYLFKGAFLDGRFGLIIAYKAMIGVMLKYTALYAREEFGVDGRKSAE